LEFDIGFLRDFYSWAQEAHAGISTMTYLRFFIWRQALGASRSGLTKPRKLARMAFGMPETNLSSHGIAENNGNLTFWHVVCQKLLSSGSYL
jgi:hypothetical protein